ncbi:MAG: glycosyltransferase family 2 protein [Acidobacteria bacterium]|nr:glycosyltransferase family 2 protein [Acidobacteriota bacterium]
MKISVCIIAYNEEKNIAAAVETVAWADEILVVDSGSTDQTREIAELHGAKIIVQKWLGFAKQKQFAVDKAEHNWVLSLDADERISTKLRYEIQHLKLVSGKDLADGYKLPRLSFYMNRPIRHGSWYPDWQLRFFNRTKGAWKNVLIHESFQMETGARVEKLTGDILHYSIENAAHHHKIIGERYAPLAARQMFEGGRQTTPLKIMTAGLTTFLQTYILKVGFLDGLPGFVIARFAAHHAFLKHLFLWEMQRTGKCETPRAEHEIEKQKQTTEAKTKIQNPKSKM